MQRFKVMSLLVIALAINATWTVAADAPKKANPDDKPSDAGAGIVRVSPQDTGDPDISFWGHLTEDQQTQAVKSLKSFAEKSADTLKHPMHLQETKFFLLYSDVSVNEAGKYLVLLDHMYGKLSELFKLQKGQNIWRGKALVFVFIRIEDYRLYERLIENNDPGGSFAMTHCFGDGMVHIAFFRYPDELQFEHLLVHESVHGFLHRYRNPVRIPSWANEGLADAFAADLIPNPQRSQDVLRLARTLPEKHGQGVGDLFTAPHIDGWQYPIAETLTAWMVRQNRQGYFDFINGIKDGQKWDESLKRSFKMTPDQLLSAYRKSLEVTAVKK